MVVHLCRDIKWQTKGTRENKLVMKKVFMLRQIFQRMTSSKQEICCNIFKVYRNIKFRSQHHKARRLCRDREVLCNDNHNKMLRELSHDIGFYCCGKD